MTSETMDVEEVIEAFNTERRRQAIDVLERDGSTTLGEMATQIAAWENEVETDAVTGPQRQRVYIAFYQRQCKKLDTAGVIEWNKNRGTIQRGPAFDHAAEVLETLRDLCTDDRDGDLEADPSPESWTLDQFVAAEGSR